MAKYLDYVDLFFGVDTFGHSAPANDIYNHFGLTKENISNVIISRLN